MNKQRYIWIFGLLGTIAIIGGTLLLLAVPNATNIDDPWINVPIKTAHTDHSDLINVSLESGPEATKLCLTCHEDASHEVMQTNHWTWQAPPVEVSWRDEPVSVGKANTLNNFCIGVQ